MKSRSLFLTLAAVAVAFSLIAAISLYWILSQSPLNLLRGGVTNYPAAAVFVPKQAPIMVSLLANPEKLESLSQLTVPISQRRQSHQEWQELKNNLLARTGLNYQQDLKPWLGDEVTVAVTSLDYDRNADNGVQPGYLLAIETKNRELAKEFLQISYSQQAIANQIELAFEQYQGVNLIYQGSLTDSEPPQVWASAFVGNFVLFANYPQVLREAINNVQAVDLNLAHAAAYQDAIKTIVQSRIGLAYANLPDASAWIGNSATPIAPEIEQILTVTLSLNPKGLVAQTALIGVEGEGNQTPALNEPVAALNYLPADSILAVAGVDLNDFWQQIQTGIAPDSPLAQFINQILISVQTPLGIDLAEEIFSWVQGEYALALVPDLVTNRLDWLFIAEKTPTINTDEIVAKLDDTARKQGLSIGNVEVEENQVTAWTKLTTSSRNQLVSLNAEFKGAHTDTERYIILAKSIETIAKALDQNHNSLLQQPNFQNAVASLPTVNDGYFYVDWETGKSIFEQKLPLIRVVELAAQSFFSHLKSLTLSSLGSENNIRRATIYFNLDFSS
jgi:hypothetical protein